MSFKLDFSEVNDNDYNIADGEYEVAVKKAEEGTNPNGKSRLHFDLVIRKDITDQRFGGAHIFDDMYPQAVDGKYNNSILMGFAKAAGLNEGQEFKDFGDFLDAFVGKPLRVRVKNEKSSWQGKEYENLRVKVRNVSKFPQVDYRANGIDLFAGGEEVNISADDLPF